MAYQEGNLPAVPSGAEIEPDVIDGEVVNDAAAQPLPAARASARAALHPAARYALRHAAYAAAGAVIVVRRWHHTRTQHLRMARSAELGGDHASALQWRQQHALERQQRHERFRGRAEMAVALLLVSWIPPLIWLGFMLAWGLAEALATDSLYGFWVPWPDWAHAFLWVLHAAVVAMIILTIAVPAAVLLALHKAGRRGGNLAPAWAVAGKPGEEDRGLVVTADAIVLALRNIPIAQMKAAFREGWHPVFHTLPVLDGQGYTAVFSVPLGVTAEQIANQAEILARNLHRAKTEVWPTDAERGKIAPAGFVSVWVANPGVLDKPAPEYPLLHEGSADVFRGVPAGVSPRGDAVSIPVVGNNFVVGGIMGQGKSNACRVLMLGAALDPLAELWVHVFAWNGDFDSYQPRLARYVKGAEAEHVAAAMDTLHELYAEVTRRETRLAELGVLKVTRRLAELHPDMRPRLALFSECHELFGHKEYGEEAADLAAAVIRKARKTAIWMGFDTQDARKDAIPPKIVGLVSVNACFAVKTWRANDGFLGDGSFQSGIRATELRPGRDVGRSLITGVSDAQFELLKWHYIKSDDEKGIDEARPVIDRALGSIAPGTAVGANSPVTAIEVRDLLTDLGQVLGTDRVKLRDTVSLLRDLAPTWGKYRRLTAVQLREDLAGEGVKTVNTSGVIWLDPAAVRDRIARREAGE